jgi:hypothetical protein
MRNACNLLLLAGKEACTFSVTALGLVRINATMLMQHQMMKTLSLNPFIIPKQ